LARPWLFRLVWQLKTTGVCDSDPSREETIAITRRYFDLMLAYRDEAYALHHIRRRISWLAKPLARFGYTSGLKEAIRTAPDAASVYAAIVNYLNDPRPKERGSIEDQEPEDVAQTAA
jgi:tRNA-dihydrouridine synthase